MKNYEFSITQVHISIISSGDTIDRGGVHKTVSNRDIKTGGFHGTTIFGDSYKSGLELVKKVLIKKSQVKK